MKNLQGSHLSLESCTRLKRSPTIPSSKSGLRFYENAGRGGVENQRTVLKKLSIKHNNQKLKF